MKPDISEFSYGYAVTEALIWDEGLPIVGAPIFPSLIEEGRSGGYKIQDKQDKGEAVCPFYFFSQPVINIAQRAVITCMEMVLFQIPKIARTEEFKEIAKKDNLRFNYDDKNRHDLTSF